MTARAIVDAVIGVTAGEIGTVRTTAGLGFQYNPGVLAALQVGGDDHAFAPPEAIEQGDGSGLFGGHIFEVRIGAPRRNPATPMSALCSARLDSYEVTVGVLSWLDSSACCGERDADLEALVLNAKQKLAAALAYPGNLLVDRDGNATDVIGGCMTGPAFAPGIPTGNYLVSDPSQCDVATWSLVGLLAVRVAQEVA